jgi:hypothetical protein
MAFRTSSLPATNNTDANFRLWINEINNALIAFGWVNNNDTGSINFSTIGRPSGSSIYQGFAVYKMGDAAQSTCACYMRLDFGTCGSTDLPGIKVQFCIGGTNGSGTLTGNLSTQITTGGGGIATAGNGNCRCSGDTSSFRMHFWSSTFAAIGWTLVIERDRDASGNDTTLGINFAFSHCNTTSTIATNSQFLETAGGTGANESRWYGLISSQSTQSGNGTTGVAPVRCVLGPFRNPMKGLLITARPDFGNETTNSIVIYGVAHTYLMLRPDSGGARSLNTWNTDSGLALLFE